MSSIWIVNHDFAMVEVSLLESLKIKFKLHWYTLKLLAVMGLLSLCVATFLMPYYSGDNGQDLIRRLRRKSNRECLADFSNQETEE